MGTGLSLTPITFYYFVPIIRQRCHYMITRRLSKLSLTGGYTCCGSPLFGATWADNKKTMSVVDGCHGRALNLRVRGITMMDLLTYMVGTVAAIGSVLLVYLLFQIYGSTTYTHND